MPKTSAQGTRREPFFPHPAAPLIGAVLLCCYLAYVALTDAQFQWQMLIALAPLFFVGRLLQQQRPAPVADALAHLKVQAGKLWVGRQGITLAKVQKVVLEQVDDKGLLQLPFNPQQGKIPELWFGAEQLPQVRAWLEHQLPQVAITT